MKQKDRLRTSESARSEAKCGIHSKASMRTYNGAIERNSLNKTLLCCMLILLCACFDKGHEVELGDGYCLRSVGDVIRDITCCNRYCRGIPLVVLDYKYNDNFIILRQVPDSQDFIHDSSIYYKYGIDSVYYWIIEKRKNAIIGPMSFHEYQDARDSLNFSNEFNLSKELPCEAQKCLNELYRRAGVLPPQ